MPDIFTLCTRGQTTQVARQLNSKTLNALHPETGMALLHIACQEGHLALVDLLLRQPDINLNSLSNEGVTPFMYACAAGHVDVVKKLLKHPQLELNKFSTTGETAFYFACQENQTKIVEILLEKPDLDVNHIEPAGASALSIACQEGYLETVRILLKDPRVDINGLQANASNPFIMACLSGSLETVKALVKVPNININAIAPTNTTALYTACENNFPIIVDFLLKQPTLNINVGRNPLVVVCENGQVDIVEKLLAHPQVAINAPMENGTMPLYIACQNGHVGIVEKLLAHPQVAINASSENSGTPLYIACQNGHVATVKLLLKTIQQRIPLEEDDKKLSVLTIACQNNHIAVVETLLAYKDLPFLKLNKLEEITRAFFNVCIEGNHEIVAILLEKLPIININAPEADSSFTPLMIACKEGHVELVKLLLKYPELEINNAGKLAALHLACQNGHLEIVKLLIAKNPDINAMEHQQGRSPLDMACAYGHEEIVALLLEQPNIEINQINFGGFTALHIAAIFNHIGITKKLLAHPEIDVNVLEEQGCTALNIACSKANLAIFKLLLQHAELDINLANGNISTPLLNAIICYVNKNTENKPIYKYIVHELLKHPQLDRALYLKIEGFEDITVFELAKILLKNHEEFATYFISSEASTTTGIAPTPLTDEVVQEITQKMQEAKALWTIYRAEKLEANSVLPRINPQPPITTYTTETSAYTLLTLNCDKVKYMCILALTYKELAKKNLFFILEPDHRCDLELLKAKNSMPVEDSYKIRKVGKLDGEPRIIGFRPEAAFTRYFPTWAAMYKDLLVLCMITSHRDIKTQKPPYFKQAMRIHAEKFFQNPEKPDEIYASLKQK